MFARWTFLVALVGLLGPAWQSSAHGQDPEAQVKEYLDDVGAYGFTITPITADYIDDTFPGTVFFAVIFRQYPIGFPPPKGLSASNVFLVQNGMVFPLVLPADLRDFFLGNLARVPGLTGAKDAGLAWLRLTEVFSQDGFFTFSAPQTKAGSSNGEIQATGSVTVTAGGRGSIHVVMEFDADGALENVSETRTVRPGVRPICQATKLLDADPLVRRMAEQDILVMGESAKEYLDEQRAKAKPELKAAIDRIWKRVVDEGW
jgi:hypothetical protein